jgi:hypothetical protein
MAPKGARVGAATGCGDALDGVGSGVYPYCPRRGCCLLSPG